MLDIWEHVRTRGNRIKLVTIYDKPSANRQNMMPLRAPELDDIHIKQILESYVGPQYKADVYYKECGSSPYIAHIIGENLRSNPGDILRQPEVGGWDRYIAYRNSVTDEEFKQRKTVLLWIAQVQYLVYDTQSDEYKMLEDKIKEYEIGPGVLAKTIEELKKIGTLRKLEEQSSKNGLTAIGELKKIGILRDSLHIMPKTLLVWLWREWYKTYGQKQPFQLGDMWTKAKSDAAYRNMLMRHVYMWRYDDVSNTRPITKEVFAPGGFADKYTLLNGHNTIERYFGAHILRMMSKANLPGAVGYLERYIYGLGMDGLRRFNIDRREAALILADAARDSRLFKRSARVLLLLIGTESQSIVDVGHIFARLFLPDPGLMGYTEMLPLKRVPLIKEALTHKIVGCRQLGIQACEAALQPQSFVKNIEDDEAWQQNMIWVPKYLTEYTDYYRSVLNTIQECLKSMNKQEISQIAKIVLSCTVNLLKFTELHDVVLSVLHEMYIKQHANPVSIDCTISDCLAYGQDYMPENLRDRLILLRDKIMGDRYHLLMKRHVGANPISDLQTPKDVRKRTMESLVRRSLDDLSAFNQELSWLVTNEAKHGYEFGYELGKMDNGSLFPSIYDAQRLCGESNVAFLGGYLCSMFHRDRDEWEQLIDSLIADRALCELVPKLTAMSGMTDKVALQIFELVKSKVDPLTLRNFKFGKLVCDVPEVVFQKWLWVLIGQNGEAYNVALNLYHVYYVHCKRPIPDSVNELLFPRDYPHRIRHSHTRDAFVWSRILSSYLRQSPTTDDIISNVVDVLFADLSYNLVMELIPVLEVVMKQNPGKTWDVISDTIDPDKCTSIRMYLVAKQVFSNGIWDIIYKVLPMAICDWIDKDIEKRAPLVAAYLLPNDIEIAVEFADKYGRADKVTDALIGNLETEFFSGPFSEHNRDKIKTIDSLLAKEKRPTAREFLEEYRDKISGSI